MKGPVSNLLVGGLADGGANARANDCADRTAQDGARRSASGCALLDIMAAGREADGKAG